MIILDLTQINDIGDDLEYGDKRFQIARSKNAHLLLLKSTRFLRQTLHEVAERCIRKQRTQTHWTPNE